MHFVATRLLALVTYEFGAIETTADDPLDAVLTTDLKGDSLDRVTLMMQIEDEFGIQISDDDDEALGHDATLRSVLDLIERKLAEKTSQRESA